MDSRQRQGGVGPRWRAGGGSPRPVPDRPGRESTQFESRDGHRTSRFARPSGPVVVRADRSNPGRQPSGSGVADDLHAQRASVIGRFDAGRDRQRLREVGSRDASRSLTFAGLGSTSMKSVRPPSRPPQPTSMASGRKDAAAQPGTPPPTPHRSTRCAGHPHRISRTGSPLEDELQHTAGDVAEPAPDQTAGQLIDREARHQQPLNVGRQRQEDVNHLLADVAEDLQPADDAGEVDVAQAIGEGCRGRPPASGRSWRSCPGCRPGRC